MTGLTKHIAIICLVAVLVVSLLPACSGAPSAQPTAGASQLTQPPEQPTKPTAQTLAGLTVGPATAVTSTSVAPSGGKIIVDKPGDALNGLAIEVPTGAYAAATKFTISQQPINSHVFGSQYTAASPLITVENGGTYANQILTVSIPVKLQPNQFAMAFHYDPTTGALDPLPLLNVGETTITVTTRHFSPVAALAVDKAYLDSINPTTDFTRGRDDWSVKNAGSILAPGGYCEGISLSEMWYYGNEAMKKTGNLWDQNTNGLGPGMETPNFWQDDKNAIKFCSMVQGNVRAERGRIYDLVSDYFKKAAQQGTTQTEKTFTPGNRIQFYAFVMALDVTKKPQLMLMANLNDGGSHSVVCYKEEDNSLFIADPNVPGHSAVLGGSIRYTDGAPGKDGKFESYLSAENLESMLAGNYHNFTLFFFKGTSSLLELEKIDALWGQFRNKTVGQGSFPEYTLRVSELDEKTASISKEYVLDRVQGASSTSRMIGVEIDEPFEGVLSVFRFEDVQAFERSYNPDKPSQAKPLATLQGVNIIQLKPGDNLLGLYVSGKGKEGWGWAGFDWVNIRHEAKTPTAATPAPVVTTAPTAAPTRAPARTAVPTPGAGVSFTTDDCECANAHSGATLADKRLEAPELLQCKYVWKSATSNLNNVKLTIMHNSATAKNVSGLFTTIRDGAIKTCQGPGCEGICETIENTDSRYTMVRGPDPKCDIGTCCNGATNWWAVRTVIYKDGVFSMGYYNTKDAGSRADALRTLDIIEACAKRAIDRYEFEEYRNQ